MQDYVGFLMFSCRFCLHPILGQLVSHIPLWEKKYIRSNRGEADLTFDTPEEADLSRDIIASSYWRYCTISHIKQYFRRILPYTALTWTLYARHLQFRFLKWPLISWYCFIQIDLLTFGYEYIMINRKRKLQTVYPLV